MNDDEFLSYCSGMTHTERCGFVPEHIARLFRLAGKEADAAKWDAAPLQIIGGCHHHVRELVAEARARLATLVDA